MIAAARACRRQYERRQYERPGMTASKGCPICGRAPDAKYRPFCTKRCADVDLGRWFNERYVVPVPAEPDDDDDAVLRETGEES